MSGLDWLERLAKNIPTVMITGYGDIPMSVRALQSGAISFLTKPLHEQDLLDAIYAGLKQHRAQLEQEERLAGLRARFHSLNRREQQILPLVTAGLLNKQIAAEVGLSEVTVKVHRHKMMVKLNARSVPDLVRIADALAIRVAEAQNA
jgi:FixJ family two-component response regulator